MQADTDKSMCILNFMPNITEKESLMIVVNYLKQKNFSNYGLTYFFLIDEETESDLFKRLGDYSFNSPNKNGLPNYFASVIPMSDKVVYHFTDGERLYESLNKLTDGNTIKMRPDQKEVQDPLLSSIQNDKAQPVKSIDSILDKINISGIESLTKEEKEILNNEKP